MRRRCSCGTAHRKPENVRMRVSRGTANGNLAEAMVVKETVFLRFSQLSKGQGGSCCYGGEQQLAQRVDRKVQHEAPVRGGPSSSSRSTCFAPCRPVSLALLTSLELRMQRSS